MCVPKAPTECLFPIVHDGAPLLSMVIQRLGLDLGLGLGLGLGLEAQTLTLGNMQGSIRTALHDCIGGGGVTAPQSFA